MAADWQTNLVSDVRGSLSDKLPDSEDRLSGQGAGHVPTFSESAYAQTKMSKTLRKKQRQAVEKLRSANPSQLVQSVG